MHSANSVWNTILQECNFCFLDNLQNLTKQAWLGINWYRCGTSHATLTYLTSGLWWIPHSKEGFLTCVTKTVLVTEYVWMLPILIIYTLSILLPLAAIVYLLKSWQSTVQERFFSFNHILCSHILPIINTSAHLLHVNSQMPCCNWIQLINMVAFWMLL